MGQNQFYDAALYYNAKMTVTLDALPFVAKAVVDVLLAMAGEVLAPQSPVSSVSQGFSQTDCRPEKPWNPCRCLTSPGFFLCWFQAEFERKKLELTYESIDEYLKSLEMIATVHSFDEFEIPRISQLTQRSNQFNLRTVRYTEAEIEQIAKDEKYLTLSFSSFKRIIIDKNNAIHTNI